MIRQLVLVPVFMTSISVFAAAPDFYTIEEKAVSPAVLNHLDSSFDAEAELNPVVTLQEMSEDLAEQLQQMVSLLNWDHHKTTLEDPAEPYNRLRHFGSWVVDRQNGGCLDTRAKVLLRQSTAPVGFSDSGCRVATGRWQDPYTNRIITEARELDIDHVVPLKNSYVSGGWRWQREKRCLYANFMANSFHLLAVNASDNRSKGQDGPDNYMPSNPSFTCEYLTIWLKIKLIWDLALPPNEASAIAGLLKQNRCSLAKVSMPVEDLRNQRRIIANQREICVSAL